MIENAQVRSAVSQVEKYATAANVFINKYNCLPGDCANATQFWGAKAGCGSSDTTPQVATCNGNGNGTIENDSGYFSGNSSGGNTMEGFYIFQHLANAGLITGQYSGGGNYATPCTSPRSGAWCQNWIPNVNVPADPFGAGFALFGLLGNNTGGSTWGPLIADLFPAGEYGHSLVYFGLTTTGQWGSGNPGISASNTASIDRKMDDGYPWSGKVIASTNSTCATGSGNGIYQTGISVNSNNGCAIAFKQLFK